RRIPLTGPSGDPCRSGTHAPSPDELGLSGRLAEVAAHAPSPSGPRRTDPPAVSGGSHATRRPALDIRATWGKAYHKDTGRRSPDDVRPITIPDAAEANTPGPPPGRKTDTAPTPIR